jgi:hypothetical protein
MLVAQGPRQLLQRAIKPVQPLKKSEIVTTYGMESVTSEIRGQSAMKRSWKKLCPQFVTDFQEVGKTPEQITKVVVDLGRQLN